MNETKHHRSSPRIAKVTLMVTERCNLRCWMCDFGANGDNAKHFPYSVKAIMAILRHEIFKDALKVITLTGGEPFIYDDIEALYKCLQETYPDLHVNFSTNGTLLGPMLKVLSTVRNFNKIGFLVSIDGIDRHDTQRGLKGAFNKTFDNIGILRQKYPKLPVTFKFTITPMNYDEVWKTWEFVRRKGFALTVKLVENNAFYNNRVGFEKNRTDFEFSENQLISVRSQIKKILRSSRFARNRSRRGEIKQAYKVISKGWTRSGTCLTPQSALFIDCNLNVFTCKEYTPVCNLSTDSLDGLANTEAYLGIVKHQNRNTGKCTHCVSQMKMMEKRMPWEKYLNILNR